MCDITPFENTSGLHIERKIGAIVALAHEAGDYRADLANHIQTWLPALYLDQVRFFHDEHSRICTFYLWARLTASVEHRVLSTQNLWLHESEWNEGDRLWMIAFGAKFVNVRAALRSVQDDALHQGGEMKAIRVRPGIATPARVLRGARRQEQDTPRQVPPC